MSAFALSAFLKVSVRSTPKCPGYLLFESGRGPMETPRKFTMFSQEWQTLKTHSEQVRASLTASQGLQFTSKTSKYSMMSVKDFPAGCLVCIERVDAQGMMLPQFSFTMTPEEFSELVKAAPAIDDQLDREIQTSHLEEKMATSSPGIKPTAMVQPTSVMQPVLLGPQQASLLRPRQRPVSYMGGKAFGYQYQCLDGQGCIVVKPGKLYATANRCKTAGMAESQAHETPTTLQVIQEEVVVPCILDLIEILITFAVMEKMTALEFERCRGCQENLVDDMFHAAGCMRPLQEKRDHLFPDAVLLVTPTTILQLYDGFASFAGLQSTAMPEVRSTLTVLSECLLFEKEDRLKEILIDMNGVDPCEYFGSIWAIIDDIRDEQRREMML